MANRDRKGTWLVASVLVALTAGAALAQPPGAGNNLAPPPAAGNKLAPPGEQEVLGLKVDASGVPIIDRFDDPVVQMLFDRERRTRAKQMGTAETDVEKWLRWTESATILADLNRPNHARWFLKQLLDANLTSAQISKLVGQLHRGTTDFVDMSLRKELAPEAQKLADQIVAATNKELQQVDRITGLIQQLRDPRLDARPRALAGLREAGGGAIGPLLAALADARRVDEYAAIRAALVYLGSQSIDPLLAALDSDNPTLVAQAALVLTALKSEMMVGMKADRAAAKTEQAVDFLVGPFAAADSPPEVRNATGTALEQIVKTVPTREVALRRLTDRAEGYYRGEVPLETDVAGNVEYWYWDNQKKAVASAVLPAREAKTRLAARLAKDALAVAPDNARLRRLHLATMLEAAAYANGLDNPLPDGPGSVLAEAAKFGVEEIDGVLREAIATDHPAAGTPAGRILGRVGTAEQVIHQGPVPSPLVQAARHADRRLRMAAVEAILQLGPSQPYAGSSYVVDALGYFAATSGTPRALVADPITREARRMAGLLEGMGYKADIAGSGREAFQLAAASPDYDLILVDAGLLHPDSNRLVQELAKDWRTRLVPLGVIARYGQLAQAEDVAARHPVAMAFYHPEDGGGMQWNVARLLERMGRRQVPFEVRQQQAARAVAWLGKLAAEPQPMYSVLRVEDALLRAHYVPHLSAGVSAVLARLGTHESQRALADLASSINMPMEARKAAAAAFAHSTKSHGIMLTTDEILRQYDRYEASEPLGKANWEIFGSILDSIEAPSKQLAARGGTDHARPTHQPHNAPPAANKEG